MARIDNLTNFLTDVANSIRNKKGTTEPIQASDFDTEISSIKSGSSKYAPRFIRFSGYDGTELDNEIANLDTSNITNMNDMFYQCRSLTNLDLSNFDTSKVTSMNQMFSYCSKLTSLDVSNFDTSSVTDMTYMFRYCKIARLDLSNFHTTNVTNMSNMFNNCSLLEFLDIRNFDFTNVKTYTNMFISVPANCLIIVKGDTEKQWVLKVRNDLTNVKTVAEYEAS